MPLLAYTRYDGNVHVAGWLFTSFGVGAVIGSVAASKLLDRIQPLHLASAGDGVRDAAALGDRRRHLLAGRPAVAVAICGFFVPMVNAPMMGILSTRPPLALRAKVMTAVMTASGLGGPLGRLAVGPVYQRLRERGRLDHGRGRPERRRGALDRGRAAPPDSDVAGVAVGQG